MRIPELLLPPKKNGSFAPPEKKPRTERIRDLLEYHLGHPLSDCPDCGAKDSLIRILIPPGARAPPTDFVYVVVK